MSVAVTLALSAATRGGIQSRPAKPKIEYKTCTHETWQDDIPAARSLQPDEAETIVWLAVVLFVLVCPLILWLDKGR